MYKDLMVPMTGGVGDADALDFAIALAGSHGAHLSALEMIDLPMPITHPWGMIPDTTAVIHASLHERGEANLARLRERLAREPIPSQARLVEALYSEAPRLAARQAFDADLTVVAGAIGDTIESVVPRAYFVALLLESGRPVVVVPPRCAVEMPIKRVTIGWRTSRETTRAVHDALPVLKTAERVDVLSIGADGAQDTESDGKRVVEHLDRHGVAAHWISRASTDQTVAAAILQHTREARADLLVVGGYGHSRLREWALGGVTRELLISADLPVFFGH